MPCKHPVDNGTQLTNFEKEIAVNRLAFGELTLMTYGWGAG